MTYPRRHEFLITAICAQIRLAKNCVKLQKLQTGDNAMNIEKKLFSMQDIGYREFHSRLMPTVDPSKIIGVRTPMLRNFAKEFAKTPESAEFLKQLPHKYYEENNLHGCLIEWIKDYDEALNELERFLPYIDNWATCDMFMPKIFKKHTDELLPKIKTWLKSGHVYTIRYAEGLLMRLYLDDNFKPEYLKWAAEIKSDEYYVNMMTAWYFATALAKQYDETVIYLTEKRLSPWVHNKTIQKAVESYRISKETKEYLKTLRISGKEKPCT